MADGIKVSIEGQKEMQDKIRRLSEMGKRSEAKEIAIAGAEVVAKRARETVHVITGALRDSIHAEESDEGALAQVVAGGGTVDYAGYEEFGTIYRPAHPYLRPAADASKEEIAHVMSEKFTELVKDIAEE